jgi:RimJ/RimL family protein N-acetyltransferase
LEDIRIRRGTEGDDRALVELLESLQEEGKVWRKMMVLKGRERSHILNLIRSDRVHNKENPGKWLFFAFDGDKMIGHVNGIAWDRAPPEAKEHTKKTKAKYNLVGKKVGHVGIAVHKDYRRRGIGDRLMRRAIQEAKELGVSVLTTSINTENTPMIRLAEKLGFKEHMRERKGERESIMMKLDLVV